MINRSNITNLKNINGGLPNMSNTLMSWFLDIELEYVEYELDGSDWVESEKKTIKTKGVVRPPSEEDLKILPEGTWAWQWLQIHCLPDVDIKPNNYVYYDGVKYQIMQKKNYNKYGYIRYTLLEAYQASQLQGA